MLAEVAFIRLPWVLASFSKYIDIASTPQVPSWHTAIIWLPIKEGMNHEEKEFVLLITSRSSLICCSNMMLCSCYNHYQWQVILQGTSHYACSYQNTLLLQCLNSIVYYHVAATPALRHTPPYGRRLRRGDFEEKEIPAVSSWCWCCLLLPFIEWGAERRGSDKMAVTIPLLHWEVRWPSLRELLVGR